MRRALVGGVDGYGTVEPVGVGVDLGRPVKGENLIFFFMFQHNEEKGLKRFVIWKVIGGVCVEVYYYSERQ